MEALSSPRIHDQISPVATTFELSSAAQNVVGYPNSTVAYLASLGHTVQYVAPGVSSACAIGYDAQKGKFDAASDPREQGSGAVVV